MDNELEKLKMLAENIRAAKLGKRGKHIHVNSRTVIDEYYEWRSESEDLFVQYFDDSNHQYKTFVDLPREGNGFSLIGYFDQQYPIFKILVKQIESGRAIKSKSNILTKNEVEGKTVFISHATKDKEIIDAFVDIILHGALSVPIDKIFYISTDGTRIKSGADWRDTIKGNLLTAKINFLIITPNYKDSEVCMNEMGAAWVTSATVLPLIIEPINYKTVGVIQEPAQVEKLLDEKSLDRIKDVVQEILKIPSSLIKSDRWTAKKKEFQVRVKNHLVANPFDISIDREAVNELLQEKENLEKTISSLIKEKTVLQSLVKELRRGKEVDVIIKKKKPSTQFQEFEELCNSVAQKLSKNSPILNSIIYQSYLGKMFTVSWKDNRIEIDKALEKDYIDENLNVLWKATRKMREIFKSLEKVFEFINGEDLKDEFYDAYEQSYDVPLNIDNKRFWEKVFKTSLSFIY